VKFNYKHDDTETKTIFFHIATDVPWLHSRKGQKPVWKKHLHALQEAGHALELQGHKDALKTFAAWAANICKTRRTARLAEARQSGVGTITTDCVDDVAERWEIKVCGEAALTVNNQERAALIRDVATSTAISLVDTAAKIQQNRDRRYSAGGSKKRGSEGSSTTPTKSIKDSTSPTSSPADPKVDPRALLLRSLASVAQGTVEQEARDKAFVLEMMSKLAPAPAPSLHEAPSQLAGDVLLLHNFLQQEDSSLVSWAAQIHAALGITAPEHFAELSAAEIASACQLHKIPLLQHKRLLTVAKRFGLGA
jgi:hypothetical protein